MRSALRTLSIAALACLALTPLQAHQPAHATRAAAAPARVTVTIDAEGVDVFGTVRSPRPRRCAAEREVKVYKIVDGEPHLWTSDTTQRRDGEHVWSIGNTGAPGRFYAELPRKAGCRADRSPTIRVRREPSLAGTHTAR